MKLFFNVLFLLVFGFYAVMVIRNIVNKKSLSRYDYKLIVIAIIILLMAVNNFL
jgi:hypothetical protein